MNICPMTHQPLDICLPTEDRRRLRVLRIELTVDNFLTVFFFNDFNNQIVKSLESIVFIDFRKAFALFQCPAK